MPPAMMNFSPTAAAAAATAAAAGEPMEAAFAARSGSNLIDNTGRPRLIESSQARARVRASARPAHKWRALGERGELDYFLLSHLTATNAAAAAVR